MFRNWLSKLSDQQCLFILLLWHIGCWTLAPILARHALPLDVLEGATWGQHLQWGYDKDPWLNAALTALVTHLTEYGDWGLYLISQLAVAVTLFVTYKLASRLTTTRYALLTVLLLEGCQYYHIAATDFNDNVLVVMCWALALYSFYNALISNRRGQWGTLGIWLGLGLSAKYSLAVLIVIMLGFMLLNPIARTRLTKSNLLITSGIVLLILLPHLQWLYFHDFMTVRYLFARTHHDKSVLNHLSNPLNFTYQQLLVFIPSLLLFSYLVFPRSASSSSTMPVTITQFNRQFLWSFAAGPLLLILLFSFIKGAELHQMWGMPLPSLWPLVLLVLWQPLITTQKFQRFFAGILGLLFIAALGFIGSLYNGGSSSSANYPARQLANTLSTMWQQRYHTPLRYVAGTRYDIGIVNYYASNHPAALINWNLKICPWINRADLLKNGAVFVWTQREFSWSKFQKMIKPQFPGVENPVFMTFPYYHDQQDLLGLWVAFLPPNTDSMSAISHSASN